MPAVRRWSRSPVVHFALSGLLVVALVAFFAVGRVQRSARDEALRNAKDVTRLAGEGIVAPALTRGALAGDRQALARLDHVVRTRVLVGPLVRVKLWQAPGRVVYSDESRLIGRRFVLGAGELRVLRHGGIEAEVSDLARPENRFERPRQQQLREVYLAIPGPSGGRLLFEAYLRDSTIAAGGRRIWRAVAPTLLGALLILELTQFPLAASLAGRLRRGQREREGLLRQAVAGSEQERQRIARDLHDGVVQDLAGVSYGLSAASADLGRDPEAAEAALRQSGQQVRQAMRQLRTLLLDLYPDGLHRQGLEGAISDLLAGAQARGLRTELELAPGLRVGPLSEALLFRGAHEGLRNVVAHARADRVSVRIAVDGDRRVLHVTDDGVGRSAVTDGRPRFGLRMLDDAARAAGGDLTVEPGADGGTVLRLTVPAEP